MYFKSIISLCDPMQDTPASNDFLDGCHVM